MKIILLSVAPSHGYMIQFANNYSYQSAQINYQEKKPVTITIQKKSESITVRPTVLRMSRLIEKIDRRQKDIPQCHSYSSKITITTPKKETFDICGSKQRAEIFNAFRKIENSSPVEK
jgi:hypothetical protein